MKTESFIPGKDASLESTIETMQKKLAARGGKPVGHRMSRGQGAAHAREDDRVR